MEEIKKYSLVFIFTEEMNRVLMIQKIKPEFQRGLLNGVGGLMESKDMDMKSCAVREMKEETNLDITKKDLTYVLTMKGKDWEVSVFAGFYRQEMGIEKQLTNEYPKWVYPGSYAKMIPNLEWIIPMCKNVLMNKESIVASIEYL